MALTKYEARAARQEYYPCILCLLGIGFLLTIILVPLSLEKLEYYEAGILARQSTGTVYREEIYQSGNHWIGPDYTFKRFPASIQGFDQTVSVWTKSGNGDAGSTMQLDISFQYKLKVADLGNLYDKVALNYAPLVTTYALDAIKNTAPLYGADEYLTERTKIEAALLANVTNALNSQIYCEVLDLQLRNIGLSADFSGVKLASAIQVETNEKTQFIQQSEVITQTTSYDVLVIQNQATEVANTATADAKLITDTATYTATQTVENARNEGLMYLIAKTGFTTEKQKASMDYILSLSNNKAKITPYINFAQLSLMQQT